jgi:DNA-binding IclR family transcriptional regulator
VDEREVGLSAIAAPVWGASSELAAIVALQGPTSRFDAAAMAAALPRLLDCARAISLALGWHPSASG